MKVIGTNFLNEVVRHWRYIIIVLLSVVLIVWTMPRTVNKGYSYEIGKPWKHNTLVAPYDFSVIKSEEQITQERDSLRLQWQPYISIDSKMAQYKLQQLNTNATVIWMQSYIRSMLLQVYDAGILDSETYKRLRAEKIDRVRLVDGKEAVSVPLANIYTPSTAYNYILHHDTLRYSVSLMQTMGIEALIESNLHYDSVRSNAAFLDLERSISKNVGMVQIGQKIIDRGEIVQSETADVIHSLLTVQNAQSTKQGYGWIAVMGQVLFVVIVLASILLYLYMYRRDYLANLKTVFLLLLFIVCYTVATSIVIDTEVANVYVIPYTLIPIVLHVFLDSRTAFITYLTTILLCSLSLNAPYIFVVLQLLTGIVAAFGMRELTQRSQLYQVVGLVVAAYILIYAAIAMGSVDYDIEDWKTYAFFACNGVLLLFSYPLLYAIERVFGFTSNVTLVELANTNNKLLRRLSEETPGTFAHTMQVSSLASAAAARIGANVQAVRTGALYHDIGKIANPQYFTENQGNTNPNDYLSYEQAARAVIAHVQDGLRLAEQYKLPKIITNFIETHHGSGIARYFLVSWQNEHPDQAPDTAKFSYPGPNPHTREEAIVMMADAVEASSRSLTEVTDENLNSLVDRMIDAQLQAGLLNDTPITLQDITTIKQVFKEKLKSIYHPRISYPEANCKSATP